MTFALPIVDQPSPARDAPAGESFDDWRWQLRNRITTKQDIAARLALTPEEEAGLEAAPGHFRVAITPYYFSLIDRDHPSCPVRMQVIPRARELEIEPGDLVDPLGEDSHSPATGIFHRYPDRCLLLALDRCAIYCFTATGGGWSVRRNRRSRARIWRRRWTTSGARRPSATS